MSNIKAIETAYNGYRFRSRLEARWAVFFDTLGIEYDYEKEGYSLGELGWYLPDFWLPTYKCFAEIKPETFTREEFAKCRSLPVGNGCLILDGKPSAKYYYLSSVCSGDQETEMYRPSLEEEYNNYLTSDANMRINLCETRFQGRLWWEFGENNGKIEFEFVPPAYSLAITRARGARFEFGESGSSNG